MDLNNQTGFDTNREVVNSNNKKVRTTIYLPVDLHRASKIYCARNDISLTQFIINFLKKTVTTSNS